MTSQPKTDANLTETERAAISIESRIESLTAAVYFLITAVLFGAMVFATVVFPNETRAGVELLDPDVRTKKAPESIDRKLLDRYEIEMPRWQRSRKKQAGIASVHYLRFERFFILVATHGHHRFFDEHDESQLQDCRRVGIKFEGYSIRYRYSDHTQKWHTLVRLDAETYKNLKGYMTELATKRSKDDLEDALRSVWFQPYRPVREQLLNILRATNRKRKAAGLEAIDWQKAIRQKRRKKPVFQEAA